MSTSSSQSPTPPSTTISTTPPTESSPVSTYGQNIVSKDDRSRFYIALTIVGGLLIVLIIAVLQGQLSETQQLAAIFSGWITSIVAFYFYGQSNAQAQAQIQTSVQAAAQSEQRATVAEKKIGNATSMLKAHAIHLAATKSAASPSDELLDEIRKQLEA